MKVVLHSIGKLHVRVLLDTSIESWASASTLKQAQFVRSCWKHYQEGAGLASPTPRALAWTARSLKTRGVGLCIEVR